jgi:hypothetical protein
MVRIDVTGFAEKIREYHQDQDRPEEWLHPCPKIEPGDDSVESRLCIPFESPRTFENYSYVDIKRYGITFGYTMRLVMQLIERAFCGLQDRTSIDDFSLAVAEAVQDFAEPFPDKEQTMCYPHFLFHGLAQPDLEGVVGRLKANGRTIHETLEASEGIIADQGYERLDGDLQLSMSDGVTDDYFGIAYLLAKQDAVLLSSASSYIAKASFFVDVSNSDIYVMTLQGRRFGSSDPNWEASPKGRRQRLDKEREYSKIGNILGMSPRRFILTQVAEFGRKSGYNRIRVIKPEEHPIYIERHKGFMGNYEHVIRKAGITEDNGCYLESKL